MAQVKFANYVRKVLTAAAAADATTLAVNSTTLLPTLGAGDWFYMVMVRLADNLKEIVKVTAFDGTAKTLTVTRAQESTAALAFSAGDRVELWLTAACINDLRTELTAASAVSSSMIAANAVVAAKIATGAVEEAKLAADAVVTAKIKDANVTAAKLAAQLQTTLGTPAYTGQVAKLANGLVYVAHGATASDWTRVNSPIATSIAAAPLFAGQMAKDSNGSWWIAVGTSSASDWLPLTADTFALRKFDTAAAPAAGFGALRISAANHLVFVPGDGGSEVDLTTSIANPLAANLAPDWDSGWTKVVANSAYSLAKSDAYDDAGAKSGGFSVASGKANAGSGYGMTDANALFNDVFDPDVSVNGVPWRFAHVLLKPLYAPGDYTSFMVLPTTCHCYNLYGFQIGYNYAGGYYEFRTGLYGTYHGVTTVVPLGWPAYYLANALVRIQAWK